MEKKYYTAKEIAELTSVKISKAYELIRQCNSEIELLNKNKTDVEKTLIIKGRVSKDYFDRKVQVNI